MPLKRSPPPFTSDQPKSRSLRAQAKPKQKTGIPQFESEATFSNTSDDERSCSSQSERLNKRKMETTPEDGDMQSAVAEMRILFSNMSSKHETQFKSLQASVGSFKAEMGEIARSMDFITQKYEEFENKLAKLEDEKLENQKYIESLEYKVEMLERRSRNTCIELRNIDKVSRTETKSHLCDLMTNLGTSLNLSIQDYDIKDIYRINTKKETHKPIVVEFTSVIKKEAVITSIRKLNKGKKKEDKLNSRHMKLDGPPKPVFVSESLSQRARKLLFLARDFAKTNEYCYCWSTNGNIYLRKAENTPLIRVRDEGALEELLGRK